MSHRIELVDPDTVSEADLASWQGCRAEAVAADLPGDPPPTRAEVVADLWPARGAERRVWFARDFSGAVLGDAWLDLYGGENEHVGEIVVRVRPAVRRRGIGTGLFDTALASSRESGRTVARSWAVDHPGPIAFARSVRMSQRDTEFRWVLRLTEVDRADLAGLATGESARCDGFTVARWAGRCPDELVDTYARVLHGLNDAPSSLLPRAWTSARVRERERRRDRRGVAVFNVAARDEATGELAGYTELGVWPGRYRAHQWGTTVSRAFRGRGFGLWMKAAMIEWLRTERPEITEYETWNNEDNPYMIAVNERLGYRPVDRWVSWRWEV